MKSIARFTDRRRPLATLLAALAFLGTAAVGLTQAPKDRSAEASPDPGPPEMVSPAEKSGATEVADPVTPVPSLRDDATPQLLVRDIPVPPGLFQGAAEGEWTDPRERLALEGIRLRAYESVAYDAATDRLFVRAEAVNQARIFDWVAAMRVMMSRHAVDPAGVPLPRRDLLEPADDHEPLKLAPGLFPDAPGGNEGERVIFVPAAGDARTDPFHLWYQGYRHFQRAKDLAISGSDDEVRDSLREALRVFRFLRDTHPTFQPDIVAKRIGIVESLLNPANSGSPQ